MPAKGRGLKPVLLGLAVAAVVACAPAQRSPGTPPNSQLITEEEIVAAGGANAFEVIRKLRPNFLTYRGETSLTGRSQPYPTVYLDGQEFGPIESLSAIPASQITSIRLLRASEPSVQYGMGNMGGVIAITTRH